MVNNKIDIKSMVKRYELEPITMQKLMVLPNLCRQQDFGCGRYRYRNNDIEPFRFIALCNGRNCGNKVRSNELLNEEAFKENSGEWTILDNPILALSKRYYDPVDEYDEYLDHSITGPTEITPVAIMTVTLNGDNAYSVFLPLGECCRDSFEKGFDHYYLGGFIWEERPFEQIMNMLHKGQKIGYTFCAIETSWEPHWGYQYGGGFRVFET